MTFPIIRNAVIAALLLGGCAKAPTMDQNGNGTAAHRKEWAIAIHGGSGTMRRDAGPEREREYLDALDSALTIGRNVLAAGGTSVDAVEAVVRHMEDNPLFNAGRGAAYNRDGMHELDAAIMVGDTKKSGAVAAVREVRNPVTLARFVMDSTMHSLMAGRGAEELADTAGIERVPDDYFHTSMREERWLEENGRGTVSAEAGEVEPDDASLDNRMGTVGAVALDRFGNVAAATSTGGLTNKLPGRVGDSPLIGIGTYADNASCAVSCTGHGEEFIRQTVAFRIAALMELKGESLDTAVTTVVDTKLRQGTGGVIAVDAKGNLSLEFNTRGMYRGAADSDGRFETAIWAKE